VLKKGIVLAVVSFFIMVSYSSTVEASASNVIIENSNCFIIGCTSNNVFLDGKPHLTNFLEDIINPMMGRIYDLIKNEDLKILIMAMFVAIELSMLSYIKLTPRQYNAKMTFGMVQWTQPSHTFIPSEGWIFTKGDNGIVNCSFDNLYGHLGEIHTSFFGVHAVLHFGIRKFTGFRIRVPLGNDYYIGYASEVKLGGYPGLSI